MQEMLGCKGVEHHLKEREDNEHCDGTKMAFECLELVMCKARCFDIL